ncbi:MAG: peptidylprolyl isomerase [Anaerolineae bacterium]|nr:peptidylprolyl isomerase [Anaerolineae bacterium]
MSKKSTTGGPRRYRYTEEDVKRRKQYRSRAERDRLWQRRAKIVAGILVVISVVALVAGIVYERIIVPNQAIVSVNGDEFSTNEFQERVRLMRWLTADQIRSIYYQLGGDLDTLSQYAGQQISQLQSPSVFGSQIMIEMEEDLLLQQYADEHGIKVDQASVDRQVDEYMASLVGLTLPLAEGQPTATLTTTPTQTPTPLVSATPSNTPAPTATSTQPPTSTPGEESADTGPTVTPTTEPTVTLTPTPTATLAPGEIQATVAKEADSYYDTATGEADVDRDTVRAVFYYDALRKAILEDFAKEVPTEELQANARHILIAFDPDAQSEQAAVPATDEQKENAMARAESVMQALQDGEPFADLAKAFSDDTGSGTSGGELGWASPDNYVAAFADAVREGEIGAIIGPIETEYGYHIIQVQGREIRPLTESERTTRQQEAYTEWLDSAKATANIKRHESWTDRIPEEPTYNELLGDILGT